MGSAVDSENLTAELKTLAAAGIGGVEVTSIYGVHGYERAFVPYLSDPWIELLLHAAAEARRLGLGLDMPPGSGWRLGGPGVRLEDAVASLRIDVDTVRGTYAANVRPAGDRVKRAAPGDDGRDAARASAPPVDRVGARARQPQPQPGARLAGQPARPLRRQRHPGNGTLRTAGRLRQRSRHQQIRLVRRACHRETTHVRR